MFKSMRCLLAIIVICLGCPSVLLSRQAETDKQQGISPISGIGNKATVSANYGHLPLSFEPNKGQADKDVEFLSRGPGFTLSLCHEEAMIRLDSAGHAGPDR